MPRGRSRGYRAERDLVILLWKRGFAVMRAPASGSKIKRAMYPDIVAIKKGKIVVFEVKSRSKEETIYIGSEQIRKLLEFTTRGGGRAYIAVKIPGKDWLFIPVEQLEPTTSGYRISRESLKGALSLNQLEVVLGLAETLEKYMKNSAETSSHTDREKV